jgi:hypothetical protein
MLAMFVPSIPLGSKYLIPNVLRCANCASIFSLISSEKPVIVKFFIISPQDKVYQPFLNISLEKLSKTLKILMVMQGIEFTKIQQYQ